MERTWFKTTASVLALLAVTAGSAAAAVDLPGRKPSEGNPVRLMQLVDTTVPAEIITRAVAVNRVKPEFITVNGKGARLTVGQMPYMHKGTLMLPLRALAEAAGGTIEWNGETWSAMVRLSDRNAEFTVGKNQAEMYLYAARYFTRNWLPMDQQVALIDGRMFISADAATTVLGMVEEVTGNDATLTLRFPAAQFAVPGEPEYKAPGTPDNTFALKWEGARLQVSGKANVPDLHLQLKLEGKVIAEADTTVKEGEYIANLLVEGGANQTGRLELVIIDPVTGRELASMPANADR